MSDLYDHLKSKIRDVPDFPTPGILYKDITTLLKDGAAFSEVIDALIDRYRGQGIEAVVALESRGYFFAAPLAAALKVSLVPVRKFGKLPAETIWIEYETEYSKDSIEIHKDLVEQLGGNVVEFAFIVELGFLKGREKLKGYDIFSMITF